VGSVSDDDDDDENKSVDENPIEADPNTANNLDDSKTGKKEAWV
jgi:hypothetical protein